MKTQPILVQFMSTESFICDITHLAKQYPRLPDSPANKQSTKRILSELARPEEQGLTNFLPALKKVGLL